MAQTEQDIIDDGRLVYPDEMLELIRPGKSYRIELPRPGYRMHIVAVLEGEDAENFVYKYWHKRKQCWIYQVEGFYWFWLRWRDGEMNN